MFNKQIPFNYVREGMFTNFPLFNHLKKGTSIQLSTTHLFNYLSKGMFIQLSVIHVFNYLKKGMFSKFPFLYFLLKNRFWDGWTKMPQNGQTNTFFGYSFLNKVNFSEKKKKAPVAT